MIENFHQTTIHEIVLLY